MSRKLPPDHIVGALLRFGFRPRDIAERFDCEPSEITGVKRRLGLALCRPGDPALFRYNGARPTSRYFG